MDSALTAHLALETPESDTRTAVVCTADVAECTCPDFCERDHEND